MPSALSVKPSHHTAPTWTETLGPEVADLCELVGYAPYPEQRLVLDDLFAIGSNGRSAVFEQGVVCARQNLKTGVLKQASIGWLFLMDQPLVVWSAHEFATSKEAFRDIEAIVEGSDYLRPRVKDIYHGSGNESIELMSGARLIFKARTSGGGRGLTGHKVILDEAFALEPQHMGALLPTLISVPDPQVVYASSAGLAKSEILRGVRDRGRKGADRLAYAEWGTEPRGCASDTCDHARGATGCSADDRELWRAANPVVARRDPAMAAIAALRDSLPPDEFVRECLGWWDDPGDATAAGIDPGAWVKCADAESAPDGRVVFGLDMTPDRSTVNVAAIGDREDGTVHGQLMQPPSRGSAWVIDFCKALNEHYQPAAFAVDNGSPAATLIADMQEAGLPVFIPKVDEYAKACGLLHDLVVSGAFAHIDQHPLNAAVEGAKAHALGRGSWVWRPRSAVPISPLIALTNALAGHEAQSAKNPALNVW